MEAGTHGWSDHASPGKPECLRSQQALVPPSSPLWEKNRLWLEQEVEVKPPRWKKLKLRMYKKKRDPEQTGFDDAFPCGKMDETSSHGWTRSGSTCPTWVKLLWKKMKRMEEEAVFWKIELIDKVGATNSILCQWRLSLFRLSTCAYTHTESHGLDLYGWVNIYGTCLNTIHCHMSICSL